LRDDVGGDAGALKLGNNSAADFSATPRNAIIHIKFSVHPGESRFTAVLLALGLALGLCPFPR
jgi:hypothetical protein